VIWPISCVACITFAITEPEIELLAAVKQLTEPANSHQLQADKKVLHRVLVDRMVKRYQELVGRYGRTLEGRLSKKRKAVALLGPLGTMGAMIMATAKAHWGKPIWGTKGGAKLPVINMATALALTLTGPGRFSLDHVLGIRLPRALVIAIAIVKAAMVAIGIASRPTPPPTPPTEKQVPSTVAADQGTERA